jgi:hypothetical protein
MGIHNATSKGFELTTTTEGVKAGFCMIEGSRNEGAIIRIEIPVHPEKAARARLEIVGGLS